MPRSGKEKPEVEFSVPETFRIIELYQEEDVLWNQGSSEYFKTEKREGALSRMKEKLEEDFPDIVKFTVDDLWRKLGNLRSYYSRQLNMTRESKKSGAGTDELYQSNWKYFKVLDVFLRAQVVPRKSTSSLDLSSQDMGESEDDDTASQCSETSQENVVSQTPKQCAIPLKKRKAGPELVMEQAVSVLAQIKARSTENSSAPVPQHEEDGDDIFGKHVAREMRQIKDLRAKGLARVKIQQLLYDAQFQTAQPLQPVPHNMNFNATLQSSANYVPDAAVAAYDASTSYTQSLMNLI